MFLWLKIVGIPLQIIWLPSNSVISLSNCIDSGFRTITVPLHGVFLGQGSYPRILWIRLRIGLARTHSEDVCFILYSGRGIFHSKIALILSPFSYWKYPHPGYLPQVSRDSLDAVFWAEFYGVFGDTLSRKFNFQGRPGICLCLRTWHLRYSNNND